MMLMSVNSRATESDISLGVMMMGRVVVVDHSVASASKMGRGSATLRKPAPIISLQHVIDRRLYPILAMIPAGR
eukprot:scaffold96674_cov45-Cyclotella_meneghiniana.AAC.1